MTEIEFPRRKRCLDFSGRQSPVVAACYNSGTVIVISNFLNLLDIVKARLKTQTAFKISILYTQKVSERTEGLRTGSLP